jgi:hypothetical protein
MAAIIDRSELFRGFGWTRGQGHRGLKAKNHLARVDAGGAVFHCKFCHALCEDYHLGQFEDKTPYSAKQYAHAKADATYGPFVADFEEFTKEFDWKAYKEETKKKKKE